MTSFELGKSLIRCWNRLRLGLPDVLGVDQGGNLESKFLLDNAESEGLNILNSPIESSSTMFHLNEYYVLLPTTYEKISGSLPRSESDADFQQMAVKFVNETVGLERMYLTLILCRKLQRPTRRTPTKSQRARALELKPSILE